MTSSGPVIAGRRTNPFWAWLAWSKFRVREEDEIHAVALCIGSSVAIPGVLVERQHVGRPVHGHFAPFDPTGWQAVAGTARVFFGIAHQVVYSCCCGPLSPVGPRSTRLRVLDSQR